ncbi:MAG: radical SAM protein, partial [Clostridia bacterium]|nr:radical SAM protein [Clostridia bacterium]
DADVYAMSGGGVTFSGGDPLMQWDFVSEVVDRLEGVHTAVETSGFTSDEVFREVMATMDLIMMDIKLTDPDRHRHFTGVDNGPILRHADMLCAGDTPFIIRMPLIPGVNDETAHFEAVAARVAGAKALVRVELLPYHKTAGAKYPLAGMTYAPEFDVDRPVQIDLEPFQRRGIPVVTM